MALIRGAKLCFEWLQRQKAFEVFTREQVQKATGWSDVSLKTYINKNKLSPFLAQLENGDLKTLCDGKDISERYFDEVFTQTAPPKVSIASGDRLQGIKNEYILQQPMGNGAIGHVWSARIAGDPTVALVAAKIMMPREDLLSDSKIADVRERFRREAKNGATLSHPNIVRYLDHGELQKNPFLVMELGVRSVGQMLTADGQLALEDAAEIARSSASALRYLHKNKCRHRDVKPDNILAFDDGYKLADLGIVRWTDFDQTLTGGGTITNASMQLGSWFYMAPEQQQSPHDAVDASDIYALGVSLIHILTGQIPSPQALRANVV